MVCMIAAPKASSACAACILMLRCGPPRSTRASTTTPSSCRSGQMPATAPTARGSSGQPANAACASGSAQILSIAAVPAAMMAASLPSR